MHFSIEQAIRQVQTENPQLTDPYETAKLAAELIPDDQLRPVLVGLIRSRVLIVNNQARSYPAQIPAAAHATPTVPTQQNTKRRKTMVAAVKAEWERILEIRLAGRVNIVDKLFRDMTAADFQIVADSRWEHVKQTAARAEEFERYGKLLAEHGVETFGELPQDVQCEALGIEQ